MRFRPGIAVCRQRFREFNRTDRIARRTGTADLLVSLLLAELVHVSNPPIDERYLTAFLPRTIDSDQLIRPGLGLAPLRPQLSAICSRSTIDLMVAIASRINHLMTYS
jgi:hypothetical protein